MYEELNFDFGELTFQVSVAAATRHSLPIPGDYGTARSIIAVVSIGAADPLNSAFGWAIEDSIDGEHWAPISNAAGALTGAFVVYTEPAYSTTRIAAPIGSRLRLNLSANAPQ